MGYLRKDSRYPLRVALLLLLIACVPLLFLYGIWHIAIPIDMIEGKIEDSLMNRGIRIEAEGLKKGLFYSLEIQRLRLYSYPFELTLSDIVARLDFTSLLRLRPSVFITSTLGGGSLKGNLFILSRKLNIDMEGVELGELRFLSDKGIRGKGIISANLALYLKGLKGDLRFSITDAVLRDLKDDVYIPLSLFNTVRGVIKFSDNAANIHSLSFEGKGIYGRVHPARRGHDDFVIELMVNSDFPMPQLIELGLLPYKKSPGYYIIPLSLENIRRKG